MKDPDPFDIIRIDRETKAIIIGKTFTIDGFAKKPVRVVSHVHADHVVGINDNILYSNYVVATPLTNELMVELGYVKKGLTSLFNKRRVDLNYGQPRVFNGETITLLPATHIVGAAQIVVETNKFRVGYTGDFKVTKETVFIDEPDVLIMEATYGHPMLRRKFKNDVEELIVDLVLDGLNKFGSVSIYGYHGKLQEVMFLLRKANIREPFVMDSRVYRVTKIVEKHLGGINNYYELRSKVSREIVNSCRYIYFEHFVKAKYRRIDGTTLNIVLSGHLFNEPLRKVDEYSWLVSFSDHGDFDDLIYYVERSKPRRIIVDGSRTGFPKEFAEELNKRGWKAFVSPT